MSYAIAVQLRANIAEALSAAYEPYGDEPDNVVPFVTLNAVKAGAELTGGRTVVLVGPPSMEYVTAGINEAEWTIWVAVPIRDAVEAWPVLDNLTEIVADAVEASGHTYGTLTSNNGEWPCTVITTTTTI